MRIRKWVALAATASIAFWAPSIVPVKGHGWRHRLQRGTRCTARRIPPIAFERFPCPTGHGGSPWPAVTVIVGVVGVMVNAAWIWRTQCRELSSQEAITSTFLPFVGMYFDAQASKCR